MSPAPAPPREEPHGRRAPMTGDGRPQLYLIADLARFPVNLADLVARALDGGVDWVQVRGGHAPAADLYALAAEIERRCGAAGAGVIVNDRIDVALAVGADGAHLGTGGLASGVVRALLAPWQIIGRSVHAPEEVAAAARAGADYVMFGHVFDTASHRGAPPKGVAALRRAVGEAAVPVFAVGGITPQNIADVAATGCAGVAVIGAILGAADPAGAAKTLRRALDEQPEPCRSLRRRVRPARAGPAAVCSGEHPHA